MVTFTGGTSANVCLLVQ